MRRPAETGGYTIIMLMAAVLAIAIGLLIALPVWQTELKREKETELIFRGKQYVEAVRLYQVKHPGQYPPSLEDLVEEKCLRRLYRDPVTRTGEWNVILATSAGRAAGSVHLQEVLVVPEKSLPSMKQPKIIGVVSSSTEKSVKIYNDQDSYDKWLFYYGQDPKKLPKIKYQEK